MRSTPPGRRAALAVPAPPISCPAPAPAPCKTPDSASALPRNPGTPLDLARVRSTRVNQPAVARRVAALNASRSVKKDHQAAWLVRAIQCMDLTTLSGDDTPGRVHRLVAKARQPVREDLLAALGLPTLQVGAVCVYHDRLRDNQLSVAAGSTEIDIVISRRHALLHDWQALYDEVRAFRAACGDAHMKAILATGELQTLENVARASWVSMMAGADFIKTSTGKEAVNATLDVSLVLVRAIRESHEATGHGVGYKPAGGISTARASTQYLTLMKEELGLRWMQPDLFRFGASSLLTDVERQLEHHVTGQYSASWRHAMP